MPPSTDAGRIFLAEGTALRPIDPLTGGYAWTVDLDGEPIWVGYLADRVLAATADRLVAFDLAKGMVQWQFDAGDPNPGRRQPNPFARPEPASQKNETPTGKLHDFHIVGDRIFCQRGERELLAIDGDSGLIDWSYAPVEGQLNPRMLVGPRRVVLQVRKPNAVVVLETDSGLGRGTFPQSEAEQAWSRDPLPIDDDRVALVIDERTVALFDVEIGQYAWTYRELSALPRSGPPRLLGDSGRLLVLRDGSELVRLDPATGEKRWSRVLGIEDLSEWPEALALDGRARLLHERADPDRLQPGRRHAAVVASSGRSADRLGRRPDPARAWSPTRARIARSKVASTPCRWSSAAATTAGSCSACCSRSRFPTWSCVWHPTRRWSPRRKAAGPWARRHPLDSPPVTPLISGSEMPRREAMARPATPARREAA